MNNSIPKIIHFCWLSNDEYPKKIKSYIEGWREKLPDYEFVNWNFERFPIEKSRWVREAFEEKKYAYAADYLRLYALYHYGGIYLDTDVEVVKSFDDLLHLPYFVGTEGDEYIEAAVIGSQKNNKWIGEALAYFEDRSFIKPDGSYDMITLPRVLRSVTATKYKTHEITPDEDIQKVLAEGKNLIGLFPKDFFCAKDMGTGEIQKTKNTYTVHHFAMSWIPKNKKAISDLKRFLMKTFGIRRIEIIIDFLKLKKLKSFS